MTAQFMLEPEPVSRRCGYPLNGNPYRSSQLVWLCGRWPTSCGGYSDQTPMCSPGPDELRVDAEVQSTIAGTLALTGFAVALVSTFGAGGSAAESLLSGVVALPVCYLVGVGIAACASVAIDAHVSRIISGEPIPDTAVAIKQIDRDGSLQDVM